MLYLLNHDALVWDKRADNGFDGKYEMYENMCAYLAEKAEIFLARFSDVYPTLAYGTGNFTIESNLCTFKNHFFGRRYPGIYADMAYARILKAEEMQVDKPVIDLFKDLYNTLPDGLIENQFGLKSVPNQKIAQMEKERGALWPATGTPYRAEMIEEM